jgi:hypothetical protein
MENAEGDLGVSIADIGTCLNVGIAGAVDMVVLFVSVSVSLCQCQRWDLFPAFQHPAPAIPGDGK